VREEKETPLGSLEGNGGASREAAFEVKNDALEVGLVEDGLLLGSAEEESRAAKVVDLASDALGVIVDGGEEGVGEEGVLATGDAEMVFDVGGGLLEVEGFEVVTDGDALVEGLKGSEAEFVGEVGLAKEDEGKQGSGIHIVVEQEAELIEEVRGKEMSLVDDEEGEAAFADEVGEGSAELGEEAGKAEGRVSLQGEQDLVVEGSDGEMGVGEIDDGVEIVVEGVGEGAESSRLAGADVAGDESGETLLEGKREAALDFLMTA
jgi:hypothetical protein